MFIFQFNYKKSGKKHQCQPMSSILGQAKTGVYVSGKQKVDDLAGVNVMLTCFSRMVKSRIVTDFSYYEVVKNEFRVTGDALCVW